MAKILLVEDQRDFAETIRDWLHSEHHVVDMAHSGAKARHFLETVTYDLIILDWGLPDACGTDICKEFRASGGATPVLMLTGRRLIEEKEEGFGSGVDDYLTKPFSLKEVSMRVKALLRRPAACVSKVVKLGVLVLDAASHSLQKNGARISLPPTEFRLLELLMRNPNQFFTADALIERLWETGAPVGEDTVRTCIRRIRKKIDAEGESSLISSIKGLGYGIEVKQ